MANGTPTVTSGLPGSLPLALYKGDSFNWQIKLWTDAAKTQPADLTGVVAKAEIRDKSGGTTIIELDCVVVQPNIIDMSLAASDSSHLTMSGGNGVWDLQLTYSDGQVKTILAGPVKVTADVTDSSTTARSSISFARDRNSKAYVR